MILAGDVGGTHTRLGLFQVVDRKVRPIRVETFLSRESASLEAIVKSFLSGRRERVAGCAVGVAGPVVDGRSSVVNLKWPVDARKLARAVGLDRANVLNDLEAAAWGVLHLPPRATANLTPGVRPHVGNAAVIAAGTGLGMAILFWDGTRHVPSASEGGHASFAPRNQLEMGLLRHIGASVDRVSIERVVSGPGLSTLYEFLRGTGLVKETESFRQRLETGDRNATIAAAGVAGEDRLAAETVELFVSLYGAVAGDLALVAKATAGVFVVGGIGAGLLPKLRSGAFLESFRAKGRLRPFVSSVPVKVVLDARAPLFGAAACAAHLHSSQR